MNVVNVVTEELYLSTECTVTPVQGSIAGGKANTGGLSPQQFALESLDLGFLLRNLFQVLDHQLLHVGSGNQQGGRIRFLLS